MRINRYEPDYRVRNVSPRASSTRIVSTRLISALAFVLPMALMPVAHATNGLFSHGYSIKSQGVAGAGVAYPFDSLSSADNPALVSTLDARVDAGLVYFSPRRSYEVSGPPTGGFPPFDGGAVVDSGSTSFLIPHLGVVRPIDNDSAFAFSMYGNGGMNTDWRASDTPTIPTPMGPMSGTFLSGDAGLDYKQLFLNFSYSRKATESIRLGGSIIGNVSKFRNSGIEGFRGFSVAPDNLVGVGSDTATGAGLKLGLVADLASNVRFGLSYQSKIKNKFDDYKGLFPDGGRLDIPATATAGIAVDAGPGTLLLDVQKYFYEDVDAIGNPGTSEFTSGLFACQGGDVNSCLGGSRGAGFGWQDMTVVKAGYQWETGSGTTWRFGVSHGSQPVRESEVTLNILAPGVVETHLSLGMTKTLSNGNEFSLALTYVPKKCVEGNSAFNPGQRIELCMKQAILGGSYSW